MPMTYTLSKTSSPDSIAIVGAGLIGRLLAWRLLREGFNVTVFERDNPGTPKSAAHTAAAMISPMSEVVVSERAIFDMGKHSLALWPHWLEELQAHHSPIQFQNTGSIVVAHPADETELAQFYRDLNFHLGTDNTAIWLERSELLKIEPDLAGQFDKALLLPGEASLDNRALLRTLAEEIERLGGRLIYDTQIEFSPCALSAAHDMSDFDWVFDCRGVGARQNQQQIRGVRGEVLWVKTDEVRLERPVRLMHPRYKLYVVPKPSQQFIIGATEIESSDRSPVSVQSMLELCSALYTLNPAFAEARILELDANLRPANLDNLPILNDHWHTLDSGKQQRTIVANGLYRHGYLLAPFIVNTVLACIEQDLPISL